MKAKAILAGILMTGMIATNVLTVSAAAAPETEKTVTLRICNWEEYIDQGD